MIDEQRAYARSTDPETSHEAAKSLSSEALSGTRKIVYETLLADGPMCDADLTVAIHKRGHPVVAESTYRHRRTDLVALGLVEWNGNHMKLSNGRRSRIWRALTSEEIEANMYAKAIQTKLGL